MSAPLLDRAADALEGASHRSLEDQVLAVARVILTAPPSEGMAAAANDEVCPLCGYDGLWSRDRKEPASIRQINDLWSAMSSALLSELQAGKE